MAIDFKNIVFKYVRIVSGTPSIDASMTDKKFYGNKPVGYYKCFIFPNATFAGYNYEDVKNLVDIEENYVWDKTNRDTFLGYNEESNKFICNISAYLGLKDSNLKTDGTINHPSQAGWYEMSVSTNKSGSIINLKQTDGSDVYLNIIEPVLGNRFVSGSTCMENNKKSTAGATIIKKYGSLWVKSPEDNSALMLCDNILKMPLNYSTKNTLYGNPLSGYALWLQTSLYGKHAVHFLSSSDQTLTGISNFTNSGYIKNNTGKEFVEYTHTSDLNDILNSGECVVFQMMPKSKHIWPAYNSSINKSFPSKSFVGTWCSIRFDFDTSSSSSIKYLNDKNGSIKGISCDLISFDPKNKPFVYEAPIGDILISGHNAQNSAVVLTSDQAIKNLPDGFIACFSSSSGAGTGSFVYRYKNGEAVKRKSAADSKYVKITGATGFGDKIYEFRGFDAGAAEVSKEDLISGKGFTDVTSSTDINIMIENRIPSITIMKV